MNSASSRPVRPYVLPLIAIAVVAAVSVGIHIRNHGRDGNATVGPAAATAPFPRERAAPSKKDRSELGDLFQQFVGVASIDGSSNVKNFLDRAKAAGFSNKEIAAFLESIAVQQPAFAFDALSRVVPDQEFRSFAVGLIKKAVAENPDQALGVLAGLTPGPAFLEGSLAFLSAAGSSFSLHDRIVQFYARFSDPAYRDFLARSDTEIGHAFAVFGDPAVGEQLQQMGDLLDNPAIGASVRGSISLRLWAQGDKTPESAVTLLGKTPDMPPLMVQGIISELSQAGCPGSELYDIAHQLPGSPQRSAGLRIVVETFKSDDADFYRIVDSLTPEELPVVGYGAANVLLKGPIETTLANLDRLSPEARETMIHMVASNLTAGPREDDLERVIALAPGAPWIDYARQLHQSWVDQHPAQ